MHQFFMTGPHMLTQVLSNCANKCLWFAYLLASVWVKCLLAIFFDQDFGFLQLLGKGCTHQHKADETGNEQTWSFFFFCNPLAEEGCLVLFHYLISLHCGNSQLSIFSPLYFLSI